MEFQKRKKQNAEIFTIILSEVLATQVRLLSK